ncbi:hypothetical protein BKA93DRAFT_625085 [Sparassis latifolia]
MTKWGRYGPAQSEFDYTPATVRESVRRSLAQLNTDYLDVVYLHDVEYVCTPVGPQEAGDHTAALAEVRAAEYGLAWGAEGKVWGEGALKILDALAELRKMQGEGFIRAVGITATPSRCRIILSRGGFWCPLHLALDDIKPSSVPKLRRAYQEV